MENTQVTQSFELTHSPTLGELAKALAKAQIAFKPVLKQSDNPAYMRGGKASKYADLATLIDATQPALAAEGLTVIQWPDVNVQDKSTRLTSMLLHSSGEWLKGVTTLPAVNRDAFTAQSCGSAITYARRYSYQAIIGAAAEDDDGNAASGVGTAEASQAVAEQKLVRKTKGQPIEAVESPANASNSTSEAFVGTAHITINPDSVTIHPVLDPSLTDKAIIKVAVDLWRKKMDAFNVTFEANSKLWVTDARTLEVLSPNIEGLGYKLKITDKSQAPLKETAGAAVAPPNAVSHKLPPAGYSTHRILERKYKPTKEGKKRWLITLAGVAKDASIWDSEIGTFLELQPPGSEIVCTLRPSKEPEKYGPSIESVFRINDTEFDDENKPILQRELV